MKLCMSGSRGHGYYVFESIHSVRPEVILSGITSGVPGDGVLAEMARTAGFSPREYVSWEAMLDAEQPDIFSIDGPFEDHARMCEGALSRGIHVFCEKPVAMNFQDLSVLEKTLRCHSAHLCSMVRPRADSALCLASEMIRNGAVGRVRLIHAQKSYKLGTRPAFFANRATGGGTIPWVGSHGIAWIQFLTGEKFLSVSAVQDSAYNRGNGSLEMTALCQYRMTHGVLASLSIDYFRPEAAPTHGDDRVRVVGTDGILEVREGVVRLTGADGEKIVRPEKNAKGVFQEFCEILIGAPDAETPERMDAETLAMTRIALLSQESADTGKTLFAGSGYGFPAPDGSIRTDGESTESLQCIRKVTSI